MGTRIGDMINVVRSLVQVLENREARSGVIYVEEALSHIVYFLLC